MSYVSWKLAPMIILAASNCFGQAAVTLSKTFTPSSVPAGTSSTLTFTLTNPNATAATGIAFSDTLPAGLTITSINTGNCPPVGSIVINNTTFTVSGYTVNAMSSCTVITLGVTSNLAGTFTNVTSAITATGLPVGAPATATLTVLPTAVTLSKTFTPSSVPAGTSSTLTFTLTNPNATAATGIAFSDTLPAGLTITSINTGDCPPVGAINISTVGASLAVSGFTVNPMSSCTVITLGVTSDLVGVFTNATSAITATGLPAGTPATAALTVTPVAAETDVPYQVRYTSNLTYADSAVILTNTGASSTALNALTGVQNGDMCVNVYAFNPDEQLISCCSCYMTPDALWSLSVVNDVLSNTLTPGVPTSVVVKLVATLSGPAGAAGAATTVQPAYYCTNAASLAGTPNFAIAEGLAAWGTTAHAVGASAILPPGGTTPPAGTTLALSETPFTPSTLSGAELARITSLCGVIQGSLGSGFGICKSCRFGGLGATAAQ